MCTFKEAPEKTKTIGFSPKPLPANSFIASCPIFSYLDADICPGQTFREANEVIASADDGHTSIHYPYEGNFYEYFRPAYTK
jgi:hypothetical protein